MARSAMAVLLLRCGVSQSASDILGVGVGGQLVKLCRGLCPKHLPDPVRSPAPTPNDIIANEAGRSAAISLVRALRFRLRSPFVSNPHEAV
jgi:hypothetical protein